MERLILGDVSWERIELGLSRVRERLERSTAALNAAGIDYAVIGGNAVSLWVSRIDAEAVRNTRDVDLLLRRDDFENARIALEQAGFVHRHSAGVDLFLDTPDTRARDALHIVFAGEKVLPGHAEAAPDVHQSEPAGPFRLVQLEPLVRMKLCAFRRRDQMHLCDLISIGLVDQSWVERLPGPLGDRLQELLDDPDEWRS